jgi:hypothetical protein
MILSELVQAYEEKSHAIVLKSGKTGPERNQHQWTGSTALSLLQQLIIIPMMAPIQRRVTESDTVGFDEIPLT